MPDGAPRRCITVWDAFSDLPKEAVESVSGGRGEAELLPYNSPPQGHLQVEQLVLHGTCLDAL
jgi:hypothetical protein